MIDQSKQYALIPELMNVADVSGLDVNKVEKLVHDFKFLVCYPPRHAPGHNSSPLFTQSGVANNYTNLVRDDLARRDTTPEQGLINLLDALWLTSMARQALLLNETYHRAILSTHTFRWAVTEFYRETGVEISLDNAALLDTELTMHDIATETYDAFKLIASPSIKEWVAGKYKESVEVIAQRPAGSNGMDPRMLQILKEKSTQNLHLDLPKVNLVMLFELLPPQITTTTVAAVIGERTQFSPLEISQIVQAILDAHTAKTFA